MRPTAPTLALLCTLAPLAAACGDGASTVRAADVDGLAQPLIRDGWSTAMVIGLAAPGRTEFYRYGAVTPGGAAPDERTVFEIGSVTKTFTALALADLVARGEATLDEPVQALLGTSTTVPSRSDKAITLLHLATHTSGLPRLPENFAPAEPADPYADYHAADLEAFLAGYALPVDPGARYEYSNLGSGLLGQALAARSGLAFPELLRLRVSAPLGLADTAVDLSGEQASRLVAGHDGDLAEAPAWHFDALAGAGALRSTAADMLRYATAHVSGEASPLAEALAQVQAPRFTVDAATQIGLGWHIADGRYRWHNGGTGGFETFVGFDPASRTAVVVLSDTAASFQPVTQVGLALLTGLAGQGLGKVVLPPLAAVGDADLQRCAGTYRFTDPSSGESVDILVERGPKGLLVSVPGLASRVGLYPSDARTYFVRAGDLPAALQFQVQADGTVPSVVLELSGEAPVTALRVG